MTTPRQSKTDLILSEIEHLRTDMTEIKKLLFGNGKEGMRIENDRNTQFRLDHVKQVEKINKMLEELTKSKIETDRNTQFRLDHVKDHDRFNRIFDNIITKLIIIFLINGVLTFSIVYAMDKIQ